MARVAARVQEMKGIKQIEVADEGITVVYDPKLTSVQAITTAFQLQGLELLP